MNQIECPICHNTENNSILHVKERLIGTREKFTYSHCSACKSIHLLDSITDFTSYYPELYHCFDDNNYPVWKKYLLKKLYEYNFWGKGLVGHLTSVVFTKIYGHKPEQNICRIADAVKIIQGKIIKSDIKSLKVLDLGCGSGGLLAQLQGIGFKNLTGVEPFGSPVYPGITFYQNTVKEYIYTAKNKGLQYDIIILSHVLEHLYDHQEILIGLKSILSENGVIVVAMPFTGELFDKYKENTFFLDAPRHVIIHSIASFTNLIKSCKMQTIKIKYETRARDIFASEMYSRDIGFKEIVNLKIKDYNQKEHIAIAKMYNQKKIGGSSTSFFITH